MKTPLLALSTRPHAVDTPSANISAPELFKKWRDLARAALLSETPPEQVWFNELDDSSGLLQPPSLFAPEPAPVAGEHKAPRVPPAFLTLAKAVACHNDPNRWHLLYAMLWRLVHESPLLLDNPADKLVIKLLRYRKEVSRDRHKMTAFVRFREISNDWFVAYHRPEHFIVELTAPFFKKRFGEQRWCIVSPHRSVSWDGASLEYTGGFAADPFSADEEFEALWCEYYRSTFNPARIKISAMKNEMPVKYWSTMPETKLIDQLLLEAPSRVKQMQERAPKAALVPKLTSLKELWPPLRTCTACPLASYATQSVPGAGNHDARLMIVGEQPGDQEDKSGSPFIGPAGSVLNELLAQAGITRTEVYVTNAVKHFKFETRGKRRIHKRPSGSEINACRPWLEAEMRMIQPEVIILLGSSAAQSVLGRLVKIGQHHLEILKRGTVPCMVTYHPSYVLRQPLEQQPKTKELILQTLLAGMGLLEASG